ncbi:BatD family protein [Marinobacter sp. S0848L]|uniref:BatD family protein n=1 Tax=Marinobacter sp. S0848L TaxID=2926423 RepID=UPI001FF50334|nr:BatD family protein [Marinobacter sp. S0848L]MCK0107173.1 BatD family protein [Marinobacter sp. S0848L]
MVKNLLSSLFYLLLLIAGPLSANELTAEPDRDQLYEGEVLTLTVKGSMNIELNLSNLFNFDLSQLPSPDIEQVEPDFEILARNQRYSVQTVNGDMVGEITWTYQLAPTRTGTLTIPALKFKDASSKPVTIEVISGTPPDQPAANRDSFVELSADKAEVYVQEQLVLTVQLYFSGNLIRGELSDPQHPDAIIESLGKQREFTTQRGGKRYRVVERRYAIFPQTPEELELPPIRFEGQVREANGALRFLRDSQQLYPVQVKPVPASYPADKPWLPADNLALAENGLPDTETLTAGSNLTRNLVMQAAGLPSEALPPLTVDYPGALRHYPEQPRRSTEPTPDGLESTLQLEAALVPVHSGEITIPEVRVPWWNTQTDQLEEAVLPARSYQIEGGSIAAEPVISEPSQPEPTTGQVSETNPDSGADSSSPWFWTTLLLGALWLITVALWWFFRKNTAGSRANDTAVTNGNEKDRFNQLITAIQNGAPETPVLLVRWARERFPDTNFNDSSEVVRYSNSQNLGDALREFQASLYAQRTQDTAKADKTVRNNLAKAVIELRQGDVRKENQNGLAPLYPAGLSS